MTTNNSGVEDAFFFTCRTQGYSPSQEKGFCDGPFLPKCSPQTKCPLSACSRGKERKQLSRKSGVLVFLYCCIRDCFIHYSWGKKWMHKQSHCLLITHWTGFTFYQRENKKDRIPNKLIPRNTFWCWNHKAISARKALERPIKAWNETCNTRMILAVKHA